MSAGTVLYRVQSASYPMNSFTPTPSHRYYGGGRFDSTDDDLYGFMYAATSMEAAIAETLLRDYPPDDITGEIIVPRAKISGRLAGAITPVVDLNLVDLTSLAGLRAVAQSTWLTMSDPRDYAQTRHWGHWIRARAPKAHGLIWQSRREPSAKSLILFDSQLPEVAGGAVIEAGQQAVELGTSGGRAWLRNLLVQYNAAVS